MSRRTRRKKKQSTPPQQAFAFRGLWRDGNYLVIDEHENHFPRRCVRTNEPVDAPQETIELTCWGPAYSDLKDLSPEQKTSVLAAKSIYRSRGTPFYSVHLRLPLNRRWHWIFRTRAGLWMLAAGMLIGFAGQLGLNSKELEPSLLLPLWRVLFVLGILLVFAGGAAGLAVRWMLSIRHMADGKIWIAGVHRDWLRPLPEYVPARHTLEHEMFRGSWQLWTYAALGISFVVLILITVVIGASREPGYPSVIVGLLVATAVALLLASLGSSQMHRARNQLAKLYPNRPKRRR